MKSNTIYLDTHATTPVDQEVLNHMLPYFTIYYGNGNHKLGWKSNSAMEEARFQVAQLIGARPTEITFTSGATEAINLALLGLARSADHKRRHIITQKTEHSAVLKCIEVLEKKGFRVTRLDVDSVGRINLEELNAAINEETLVVAIMLANNEIGTVQAIKEIGAKCRTWGAKFFCDLTQGLGWHSISVDEMNIDLAAMSSHKIYGPRGVGALFCRRKFSKTEIQPILFGGGQEKGIRPGTANIPGIVGFGKACQIQKDNGSSIAKKTGELRDHLQKQLFDGIEGVKLNGCPVNRHPGNLNIAIPGIRGEELLGRLPNIMFSTGSACTSGSAKPSYVIQSLGVEEWVLKSSLRFGISKFNTPSEIDYVAAQIIQQVNQIQSRKPTTALI